MRQSYLDDNENRDYGVAAGIGIAIGLDIVIVAVILLVIKVLGGN